MKAYIFFSVGPFDCDQGGALKTGRGSGDVCIFPFGVSEDKQWAKVC